jgi:hypothetical protein
MRVVENEWWIVDLPDEWEVEQDEETILIRDQDDVGEIAITSLQKEYGVVDDAELQEYTVELIDLFGPGQSVRLADFQGYYFSFKEQGDAVREWYLRYNKLLLLITYSCDEENEGMDDAAVDEILSTLFCKDV